MGDAFITRRGVTPESGLVIDPGLIVEWYGLSTALPEGWLLCDGTNSTPDLRDKFIVGAGDTYAVNATGGSADAILPSHSHTGTTNTTGNHGHSIPKQNSGASYDNGSAFGLSGSNSIYSNTTSAGSHSHSGTASTVGVPATNANLPPYLSLFFIVKGEN